MALTLLAEVQTEKQKISHKPILMIDFTDRGVYVASRAYTLSLTAGGDRMYDDLIKQDSFAEISHDINEMFGTLAGTPQVNVSLLDYRGTLRSSLLGTTPDLTGSAVSVYLKFDTTSTAEADRVQLFSGIVADYTQSRDVLSLTLQTIWLNEMPSLPKTLLRELYSDSAADADVAAPLQYGDFNWAEDPLFTADLDNKHTYAIAPYVKNDGTNYLFYVAGHQMNAMPTAAQINNTDGDAYLFLRRDNMWVHLVSPSATVTNGTGGAYIELLLTGGYSCYIFLYPTATYTGNSANYPLQAVDGYKNTYATMDGSLSEVLKLHDWKVGQLEENQVQLSIDFYVYFYNATGINPTWGKVEVIRKSDDVVVLSYSVPQNVTTGQWLNIGTLDVAGSFIDNYYIVVTPYTGSNFYISGVVARLSVQVFDPTQDDPCVYVRCKGRSFSSNWDGRRTSGALITHPVDMVESIVRDELGETPDTATFDIVKALSTHTVAATIFKQTAAKELLSDICKQFGYGLTFSPTGNIAIMKPDTTALNFTDSGTTTPSNEDILTDSETKTGDAFDQHPILLGGFSLKRTSVNDVVKKVTIKYGQLWGGNFLKQVSSGTGTPELTLKNKYIIDSTVAANIASEQLSWRSTQKFIAEVVTFFNALGFELGDVRNIRHSDLNDSILADTVNSQRWMLFSYALDYTRGLIKLKFVEMR